MFNAEQHQFRSILSATSKRRTQREYSITKCSILDLYIQLETGYDDKQRGDSNLSLGSAFHVAELLMFHGELPP